MRHFVTFGYVGRHFHFRCKPISGSTGSDDVEALKLESVLAAVGILLAPMIEVEMCCWVFHKYNDDKSRNHFRFSSSHLGFLV